MKEKYVADARLRAAEKSEKRILAEQQRLVKVMENMKKDYEKADANRKEELAKTMEKHEADMDVIKQELEASKKERLEASAAAEEVNQKIEAAKQQHRISNFVGGIGKMFAGLGIAMVGAEAEDDELFSNGLSAWGDGLMRSMSIWQ